MPLGFGWEVTTRSSGLQAGLILLIVLLVGFVLGRFTKKPPPPPKPLPLPTKADLDHMSEALRSWMDFSGAIAGWKAATYGAVGVLLGAAGGLFADYVTHGEMSSAQILRAFGVVVFLLGILTLVVILVEVFEPIDSLVRKLKALRAGRSAPGQ